MSELCSLSPVLCGPAEASRNGRACLALPPRSSHCSGEQHSKPSGRSGCAKPWAAMSISGGARRAHGGVGLACVDCSRASAPPRSSARRGNLRHRAITEPAEGRRSSATRLSAARGACRAVNDKAQALQPARRRRFDVGPVPKLEKGPRVSIHPSAAPPDATGSPGLKAMPPRRTD
jgi:hypothetical protein